MAFIHTKDKKLIKVPKISILTSQLDIYYAKEIRAAFLELDSKLKKFGRTKCKFHRNRKNKQTGILECNHPVMSYGGINRNTECELKNCPRVLHGDEGD